MASLGTGFHIDTMSLVDGILSGVLSFNLLYDEDWASQVVPVVKNLPANAGGMGGFEPWVGKIPWRRAWQPILLFLPGEFHG